MSKHRTIYFCTASRSERGLIESLLRRLERRFALKLVELPQSLPDAFHAIRAFILDHGKPDLVFTPFDRVEMLGASLGCMISNVPTAQIQAGDLSQGGTWDDVTRHMITLGSSFQFCVTKLSHVRATTLLMTVGRSIGHCYLVHPIQFDDMVIDHSACPSEPFDLVLYNPPTTHLGLIEEELDLIEVQLDKPTIWIDPNGDRGSREILLRMSYLTESMRGRVELGKERRVTVLKTVPRPQFLGLLERCDRAIGNSSSFFLELPYFRKHHLHIGVRNQGRERLSPEEAVPGGSAQIVKILEAVL